MCIGILATIEILINQNPSGNNVINMQFNNQPAGVYTVQLFNTLGQLFFTKKIMHTTGNISEIISVDRTISKGIYKVQIIKPDNSIIINRLVL